MDNIKEKAIEFLVANNLGEMPKNMLKLNNYNLDFKIMTYAEANELIVQKNWEYYTENYKGFTACMPNGEKWIFYSEKLPYSERNFVITHEIGHIVLEHTIYGKILGKSKNKSDKVSESLQEKEADAFALALLAPPAVLLELGCYSPLKYQK